MALRVGELLVGGGHSTACPIVDSSFLDAILVGIATVLVESILCVLVLHKLRLAGRLHLTRESAWNVLSWLSLLIFLRYLSTHAVVGSCGPLVQLNVVQLYLSNI